MSRQFSSTELESYLDEALPPEQMVEVEQAMRDDRSLGKRLASINGRRDAGIHSLGEIWRRNRLSCPSREQLGSYLLKAMPKEASQFIQFHLEVSKCRQCRANLEDLQAQQSAESDVAARRKKYFQSSAGYLSK